MTWHVIFAGGSGVLKVLIAEDDFMIADMIEEALVTNGYEVCGLAPTVREAVALGRERRPDLAVIDMRLADGGLGTEIAPLLPDGPRIGILYASGNINQVIAMADRDACIVKPYRMEDLLRALDIVAGIAIRGIAGTPPFPRGFHLLNANKMQLKERSNA
jgi:DNA-binding response OmpR family regulator